MKNEASLLKINRLLTPDNQAVLHDWLCLAYTAESSVKKSLGYYPAVDGIVSVNLQEYSCRNIAKRRKK